MRPSLLTRTFIILLVTLIASSTAISVNARPFSRQRLERTLTWIRSQPEPVEQALRTALADEIRKRGVEFQFNRDVERYLAMAGARSLEMLAVRESYRDSPFTLNQVKNAVEKIYGKTTDREIRAKVVGDLRRRGVEFRVDADVEKQLTSLGADEVLIAELMKGYRGTEYSAGWIEIGESVTAIGVDAATGKVYVAGGSEPSKLWSILRSDNKAVKISELFQDRISSILYVDPVSKRVIVPAGGSEKVLTFGEALPDKKTFEVKYTILTGISLDPLETSLYLPQLVQKGAGPAYNGYRAVTSVPKDSGVGVLSLKDGSFKMIVVGDAVKDIALSPTRKLAFATYGNGVAIIDTGEGTVKKKVTISRGLCSLALHSLSISAFVGDCPSKRIFHIGSDGSLARSFESRVIPRNLEVDPVSSRLYWISEEGLAWSGPDGKDLKTLQKDFLDKSKMAGMLRRRIAVDPMRDRAFAVAEGGSSVAVIESGSADVKTIKLPGRAVGLLALYTVSGSLYVPLNNGNVAIVAEGAP